MSEFDFSDVAEDTPTIPRFDPAKVADDDALPAAADPAAPDADGYSDWLTVNVTSTETKPWAKRCSKSIVETLGEVRHALKFAKEHGVGLKITIEDEWMTDEDAAEWNSLRGMGYL